MKKLGDVPLERIRTFPPPGCATEDDVLRIEAREGRLCELIDGTLVEKPMGYDESVVAGNVLTALNNFVRPRRLGRVSGEAGMMKVLRGMILIPDVAYVSKERRSLLREPKAQVPRIAPDLAVEVLSPSNTQREMEKKLDYYFKAGVRMVWIIDPTAQTAEVYRGRKKSFSISANGRLEGHDVLPGFRLALKEVFDDPAEDDS
ncbi:MAG: Uma2 family endonuclease [Planctomycetia bacterium]|nr:Uma2 family endonuclease [Planctomycetia bacterium]